MPDLSLAASALFAGAASATVTQAVVVGGTSGTLDAGASATLAELDNNLANNSASSTIAVASTPAPTSDTGSGAVVAARSTG